MVTCKPVLNEEFKAKRRHYKAALALLPSVDHVGDGLGEADFKICGWRTQRRQERFDA